MRDVYPRIRLPVSYLYPLFVIINMHIQFYCSAILLVRIFFIDIVIAWEEKSKFQSLIPANCWARGEWLNDKKDNGILFKYYLGYEDKSGDEKLRNCEVNYPPNNYSFSINWKWKPLNQDKCPYYYPTKTSFCKQLNGEKILFVGDSLSHHFFLTIASFVGDFDSEHNLIKITNRNMKYLDLEIEYSICGSKSTMLFIRNDILSLVEKEEINMTEMWDYFGNEKENFLEYPWVDDFRSGKYKYAIFNRGAHYLPKMVMYDSLKLLLPFIEKYTVKNKGFALFRNLVSGHINCANYFGPAVPEDGPHKYNWHKFKNINQICEEGFKSLRNGIILDVNTSTNLRPDMHVTKIDCLHYCVPGPIDNWVVYFYNILIILNKSLDRLE